MRVLAGLASSENGRNEEEKIISLTNSFCGQERIRFRSAPEKLSRVRVRGMRDVFLMWAGAAASRTKTQLFVFSPCHFPGELGEACLS